MRIRAGPSADAEKLKLRIKSREEFAVSEIIVAEPPQRYLRLKDGSGWAFTHSFTTGEEIVTEVS